MDTLGKVRVGLVFPEIKWVDFKGRIYKIDKIGLHHKYYQGKTLYHIFSVSSGSLFLKLKLNSINLTWNLEEMYESKF